MFGDLKVVSKAVLIVSLAGCSAAVCGCGEPVTADQNTVKPQSTPATAATASALDGRTREALAILRVLNADRNTSRVSVSADGSTPDYFQQVITNMLRIELYECPEEFRQAYKRHILAWQMCLRAVQSQGQGLARISDWNAVAVLHGTEPRDEQERILFMAMREMEETYNECVRIASAYAVDESEYRQ
jgi:hypothetical protein